MAKKSKNTKQPKEKCEDIKKLMKENIFAFSLGFATLFVSFGLAIGLLVMFYKPSNIKIHNLESVENQVTPTTSIRKHTVQLGETLYLIAERYYGDGEQMDKIVKANNILNPDNIEVGMELIIP